MSTGTVRVPSLIGTADANTNDGTFTNDTLATRLTPTRFDVRGRANLPGGRIEHDLAAARAGIDQAALQSDRHDRYDAVAAHRAESLVVYEQHAGVRVDALGLGEERAVHVEMPAGLEHEQAAQMILMLTRPGAPLQHRPARRGGPAGGDQTERFPAGVGVDGGHGRWTVSHDMAEKRLTWR